MPNKFCYGLGGGIWKKLSISPSGSGVSRCRFLNLSDDFSSWEQKNPCRHLIARNQYDRASICLPADKRTALLMSLLISTRWPERSVHIGPHAGVAVRDRSEERRVGK